MLILNEQVLANEARRYLNDLNKLMMEDQDLAGHQVYLKKHLVRYSMDVSLIDLDLTLVQPSGKGQALPIKGVLVVLKSRDLREVLHLVFSDRVLGRVRDAQL